MCGLLRQGQLACLCGYVQLYRMLGLVVDYLVRACLIRLLPTLPPGAFHHATQLFGWLHSGLG